jgi:hypothetical protein
MKNFWFLIVLSIYLMACDKVKPIEPNPTNEVPEAVINAVKTAFNDASGLTVIILKQKELYEVDFVSQSRTFEAIITEQGEMNELRQNAKTLNVSQNIQNYIDTHFFGAVITETIEELDPQDKTTVIGFWVYITTTDAKSYQLNFDVVGAFVGQIELTGTPGDSTNSNMSKYSILESDLNSMITNYLATNHNGYTFSEGWAVVIDNVTSYFIIINVNSEVFYYEFSADGTVISVSSYVGGTNSGGGAGSFDAFVDVTQVPVDISNYLDQNFAGWQFLKGGVESDNGTVLRYVLLIMIGNNNYYVEFDANKQFVGATVY